MSAEWTSTLLLATMYAIVAISMQLGMMSGAFSLAPVGWMGVGAYVCALCATKWHVPSGLGLLIVIVIATVVGPVVMFPVRRISGLYFALVSLAFVLVVQTAFANLSYTGASLGIYGVPLTTNQTKATIALVAVAVVAAWMSTGARGRALRASGQDPLVADSLGFNVSRVHLAVGSVTAVFSVVAGFLYAGYVGYIDPTAYGFALVIQILVMVIIGGRGSWLGAIVGAFLITSLPVVLRPLSGWRDDVNGALLIIVAILLPGGLVSLVVLLGRRLGLSGRDHRIRAGTLAQTDPGGDDSEFGGLADLAVDRTGQSL